MSDSSTCPFHVAIIGGGITGLSLAIALHARSIPFTLYERSPGFGEIGAGIGFSPNAEAAMAGIDSRLLEAYSRVANPNGDDYFKWVDGYRTGEVMFKLYLGKDGFRACKRAEFLEEVAKLVPKEKVKFGKQLRDIQKAEGGRVRTLFDDGTTAETDVVVGCDGIWSQVRRHVVGENHPSARSGFSKKICFRALIPMEHARSVLPEPKLAPRFMYNGPDAHLITYPVGMNAFLNVLVVVSEPEWTQPEGKHVGETKGGSKAKAEAAFRGWHPTPRAVVSLLPENLDTWAIFDMFENPAPAFRRGRVCVAGDAAHAAGPHLGAGAGLGIEDALVLAGVLKKAKEEAEAQDCRVGGPDVGLLLEAALKKYDAARRPRTQAVVAHTREAVDLFQWKEGCGGEEAETFGREITRRFRNVWENGGLEGW